MPMSLIPPRGTFCSLNMRKFGGPGTLKQPCVARRCAGEVLVFEGPPLAKKPKSGGRAFSVQQRAPQHQAGAADGLGEGDGGAWGSLHIAALYSEGYEPFDPDVSSSVLERCGHLGYDARATHFYCALDGGVALSRCESMEQSPDGDALAQARGQRPAADSTWDRARVLASVALEPGTHFSPPAKQPRSSVF